jgi:hypothetical protein
MNALTRWSVLTVHLAKTAKAQSQHIQVKIA